MNPDSRSLKLGVRATSCAFLLLGVLTTSLGAQGSAVPPSVTRPVKYLASARTRHPPETVSPTLPTAAIRRKSPVTSDTRLLSHRPAKLAKGVAQESGVLSPPTGNRPSKVRKNPGLPTIQR